MLYVPGLQKPVCSVGEGTRETGKAEQWFGYAQGCFACILRGRSRQTGQKGKEEGGFSVPSLSYATFPISLFSVGSNVPDGCRSAGVHAGQQGPAAGSRDWAPAATGLLPVPGALPRRVHACTQARAGTERWGFLAVNASLSGCTENNVIPPWLLVCKARSREKFDVWPSGESNTF